MAQLLKKAVREQSAAKVGGFGPGGSGKSLTMSLLAIALSKTFHGGAPVVLQDTEGASDWLLDIYEAEGIELYRIKSQSFVDMRQALREAEDVKACGFISDSYSHPWAELQKSLKKRLNVKKLEFNHMQELQELWSEWVSQFLNSPVHCFLAGRLAYDWENEVDVDTGKMGFHKSGTKMRSEKDAGYEPHLLFEMEAVRVLDEVRETKVKANGGSTRIRKTKVERKAGGHFLHRLHVLKDRARVLNGSMFEFPDINNYKPGDWRVVYKALAPHFERMNINGASNHAVDSNRSSAALFDARGDSDYNQRVKKVNILLEEIDGTLNVLWPGQGAKEKALRNLAVETLFNTRSWTSVESAPLEILESRHGALRLFESAVKSPEQVGALVDPAAVAKLLAMCKDEIASGARVAEEAAVL